MPIINGTDWSVDDFTPFSYYENWDLFWTDVMAEVANVEADRIAAQAAQAGAETARDAAAGSAGAAAADRVQTGADRAATGTALATAQALVGSAGTGTATGLAFAALTKSLATATDVVAVTLYLAEQDSDGGAWRRRPFGSWYWETLNTATRGARREFPAAAGIVTRAASLTIYDLHDLDATGVPRMWMVITNGGAGWSTSNVLNGSNITVFALNGPLYVGESTGNYGFVEIDFCRDRAFRRTGASGFGGDYRGTIAQRNTGLGYAQNLTVSQTLASTTVHNVHARVIPGGPLDSAGLPIPTVAVATAGGVSVIHPNGAVHDITGAAFRGVSLTASGRLLVMYDASAQVDVGVVPYADVARTSWRQYAYSPTNVPVLAPSTATAQSLSAQAIGYSDRLTLLAEDTGNPANGMTAFVATNYATGWQPGDIRGAYLCDTTTGNITGSAELVTNGDFASGTTGWAGGSATLSVSSGALRVTTTASGGVGYQGVSTVAGQTYMLKLDLVAQSTAGAFVAIDTTPGSGGLKFQSISSIASGILVQFTAASATTYISLGHNVSGASADFDNVSCRLALPDRSYKGKGLVVNGTLGRTALPCGLAAVSGSSASNYLEQPYNPDFDFGTGDFCFSGWLLHSAGGSIRTIADRGQLTSPYTNPFISLETSATDFPRMFIRDAGGTQNSVTSAVALVPGQWSHLAWISRGATLEMWVDGVRTATATRTATGSISNASAVLRVGLGVDGARPYPGSIAMLRAAAYAPTPAQIRKMYEDERALIVGGTPATLGGTSNSVTALAANEATGTLTVGTGDGISIFAGLGRVQYLDGASGGAAIANDVITALSASGPHLLIGTSAGAGIISDSVIARDRMLPAGPPVPRAASDPEEIRARAVTTDATPTDMSPRLIIGEREAVTVDVTVQARTYGATSTQGGTYRRLARYIRDAGGAVTLAGSVQVIGADQETAAGMDVTIQADTAAQTITPRVTGVAGTRMVWTARIVVTRISEEASYAA